jgi:hypothetical protein
MVIKIALAMLHVVMPLPFVLVAICKLVNSVPFSAVSHHIPLVLILVRVL